MNFKRGGGGALSEWTIDIPGFWSKGNCVVGIARETVLAPDNFLQKNLLFGQQKPED